MRKHMFTELGLHTNFHLEMELSREIVDVLNVS